MATTTENLYTGDGSTDLFSFTFPYISVGDVNVSIGGTDLTVLTEYIFANATTIQILTPPADGSAIRIYRQTDVSDVKALFFPGSAIRAGDLNDNFTQTLYVVQEAGDQALVAGEEAAEAAASAAAAQTAAALAASEAATASSEAAAAQTAAQNALDTANAIDVDVSALTEDVEQAQQDAAAAAADAEAAQVAAAAAEAVANLEGRLRPQKPAALFSHIFGKEEVPWIYSYPKGTHAELIQAGERYSAMYQQQGD